MTEQYLSLSEAQNYTGKTRNRLRRFVEAITKPDSHPDRPFVKPSQIEVAELHKNKHPFSWKISIELLDREFKEERSVRENAKENNSQVSEVAYELLSKTIAMLETELAAKNKQINEFLERQRETNILMLPEEKKQRGKNDEVVAAYSNKSEEKGSHAAESSRPKKKPSLWERLNSPVRIRK